MNEAETRADYIDPALKAAGWGVMIVAASGVSTRLLPVALKGGITARCGAASR